MVPKPNEDPEGPNDAIGVAARAFTEAAGELAAVLNRQAKAIGPASMEGVAGGLRAAAKGLSNVSAAVDRKATNTSGNRRQSKADKTRADLLAAAAQVIAEKGYEGASVGDIAAAAGYTKGAFYTHFPAKSDVLLALATDLLSCTELVSGGAEPVVLGIADSERLIAEQLRSVTVEPVFLLSLEILTFALRHPESREQISAAYAEGLRRFAGQLAATRQGMRAGDADRCEDADRHEVEPAQEDWDRAIVILGVSNLTPLLYSVTGMPELSPESAARVITGL